MEQNFEEAFSYGNGIPAWLPAAELSETAGNLHENSEAGKCRFLTRRHRVREIQQFNFIVTLLKK